MKKFNPRNPFRPRPKKGDSEEMATDILRKAWLGALRVPRQYIFGSRRYSTTSVSLREAER